jgi:DNA primase
VNYDPDSAGVAATERSLALLLEEGFEAKVLALPGGLDPDSFIRKEGAAAYAKRLASAPPYLVYLTDLAVKQHDVSKPEGRQAVANSLLAYLAKIGDPIRRKEQASALAARAFVDDKLFRGEVERAAGERRTQVRVRDEVDAATANLAVKQLVRACLENERLADELLPELVDRGMFEGLPGEGIFKRLWELRQGGEKLDMSRLGELLSPEERNLAHESLLRSGRVPEFNESMGHVRALRRRKGLRERDRLDGAIQEAMQLKNWAKVRELDQAKSNLENELRGLEEGRKISIH